MTDPKPVPVFPSRFDAYGGHGYVRVTGADGGAKAHSAQSNDHSSTASTVAQDRERSRMESHSLIKQS